MLKERLTLMTSPGSFRDLKSGDSEDERAHLGGGGEAIKYVVKMHYGKRIQYFSLNRD